MRKLEIRLKSHRNLWDFPKSGGNLIGFDEISLDPVKISLDLLEISPESGFFGKDLGFFRRILQFFSPESGFFSGQFRFFEFWGTETEPTRRSWFMGGENSPSTSRIIGSIGFRSISVGSSGWVESRMGLDRPTFFSFAIATILHSLISNSAFSCNKYSLSLSLSPSLCFALLYYHFKLSHTLELSSQHSLLLVFFFFSPFSLC